MPTSQRPTKIRRSLVTKICRSLATKPIITFVPINCDENKHHQHQGGLWEGCGGWGRGSINKESIFYTLLHPGGWWMGPSARHSSTNKQTNKQTNKKTNKQGHARCNDPARFERSHMHLPVVFHNPSGTLWRCLL